MSDETELEQAGFDAIAEAMHRLYPGQEGLFYSTIIPYALGGDDPLDGVEVWESGHGVPHWHYVTYGFTELYEKESGDPEESGYGFELTFRLKRGEEEQPPVWPVNLLQNLARKSKVFLKLTDEVSNFITESSKSSVMLSQDIKEDQDNWDARFRKNFAERFTHIPIASPFKITYMQVAQVPLSLCLDLYEPEQEVPGSPEREETETKGEPKVE